jgi:segregation and condensation protein B
MELLAARLVSGIRLQIHDNKVQLVSAPENSAIVQRFLGAVKMSPLSRQALEALAVVAYHQPVTRAEVEAMRGVNSDRALHTLLARGLIEERGQRKTIGRPQEFGTTFTFLEYFGLASLQDLPPLDEKPKLEADPRALGMRG